MQKTSLFVTLQQLKLKAAPVTQTRPMPFWNGVLRGSYGIGSKNAIQKLVYVLQKDWKFLGLKGWQVQHTLKNLYRQHKYPPNHIWNSNEISIQARWQFGAQVLAKQGSWEVYNTIPMSWKWLTINYVVNVAKATILAFYIFRISWMREDYIKLCKPRSSMAMKKKNWMITYLFN